MMDKKRQILPFFLVQKGCPHACSYCKQEDISGSTGVTPEDVQSQLSTAQGPYDEIAYYGGSFTALHKDERISFYAAAKLLLDDGRAKGIRISTRPDGISEAIIQELVQHGVTTVELGVQSMDDAVLIKNKRGHTAQDVKKAVRLLKDSPLQLGLQMMTGLPGDSPDGAIQTAEAIAAMEPDFVRIYPVLVFDGTALATWYRTGVYTPPTLYDTVKLCATLTKLFTTQNIPIIRMGLHDEEAMHDEDAYLAGPMHPAFGDLVHDYIFMEHLQKKLSGVKGTVTIEGPAWALQHVAGHRRHVRGALEHRDLKLKLKCASIECIRASGDAEFTITWDTLYQYERKEAQIAFKTN